jgi:hypothetical protein
MIKAINTPPEFAVFVLTHGRADNVITVDTLRKHGYTGRIVVLIDNEDKQENAYRARYGEQVHVFNKLDVASRIDAADNFSDRRAIIYARVAAYEVARSLGIRYFIQLDDDYHDFYYRVYDEDRMSMSRRGGWQVWNLDNVFAAYFRFLQCVPCHTIAFAQGGDFIGGRFNQFASAPTLRRKAMNSFFCDTDRQIPFLGRVNEDVNTYVGFGMRGMLFFTAPFISLEQAQTQSNTGGMTELYLDSGTYIKSFYTVLVAPSCVFIGLVGRTNMRLHHKVQWRYAVPKIVHERHKKIDKATKNRQ